MGNGGSQKGLEKKKWELRMPKETEQEVGIFFDWISYCLVSRTSLLLVFNENDFQISCNKTMGYNVNV